MFYFLVHISFHLASSVIQGVTITNKCDSSCFKSRRCLRFCLTQKGCVTERGRERVRLDSVCGGAREEREEWGRGQCRTSITPACVSLSLLPKDEKLSRVSNKQNKRRATKRQTVLLLFCINILRFCLLISF
jgi:hypothetical protein